MDKPRRPFSKPSFPKPAPKPVANAEPKLCSKCQVELEPGALFCGECGTPVKAGLKPMRSFADIRDKAETRKNKNSIRSGRNYLLMIGILEVLTCVLACLIFAPGMKARVAESTPEYRALLEKNEPHEFIVEEQIVWTARNFVTICILTTGLPALIYFGLFVWAKSNPLPAITVGMVTYITSVIAWIVFTHGAMLGGALVWIYRFGVIGALSDAIRSATSERRRAEKKKRQQERERLEREAETGGDDAVETTG